MAIDYKGKMFYSMSQAKFNELRATNGGKLPSEYANSYIMTDAEDVNLSQLRTELVYDMNSANPEKNWGYTSGIQGGNTAIGGKDFSKYTFLIITARQGNASMTSIMDLTVLNTFSNTYNSGALGCEVQDTDYCKFTVNADKTEFTCNRIGYRTTSGSSVDMVHENAVCMKIVGVIKIPAMIYTGKELYEGNDISIEDGVVSVKRNIIQLAHWGTDASYTSDVEHFPTFSIKGQVGNALNLFNNGVLIGPNVKKIKVSCYLNYWTNGAGKTIMVLKKNGTQIQSIENQINASISTQSSLPDYILNVVEGDLITLSFQCNASGYLWSGADRLYLTAEVIE